MKCIRRFGFAWIAIVALAVLTCRNASAASEEPAAVPSTASPSADERRMQDTVSWLESRVRKDPEDFVAHNRLGSHYLQRLRETGDATFLERAARAARASLAAVPAAQNKQGLNLLAQVEFAGHDFDGALEHARTLVRLDPDRAYAYQILGDALLELGDYAQAKAAFAKMQELGGVQGITRAATAQRLARMASLHGDAAAARLGFTTALELVLALPVQDRETVAWCRWQLGETAFSLGDYATAEQHYREALTSFPDYFRALASLARVRAARGDLADAITLYERAVNILPDPSFVAALGDVYLLSGREREAARQYDLVEAIARLGAAGGALYNRQQALFYADHDRKPEEAYAMAVREYAVRRDIYGADAVAWTALKAGRLDEAKATIREALRLNTRDARLYYHAGMIALAASDVASGRAFLERALALSPQFDPLQASIARKTLAAGIEHADGRASGASHPTSGSIAEVRP